MNGMNGLINMKKLTDFGKIAYLADRITVEKVYPLSIIEGFQKGEILVDDEENPTVALIWHYCGFANVTGDYNQGFIEEIMQMMQDPPEGHSGRMALQTENDDRLQDLIMRSPGVARSERYVFAFAGEKSDISNTMKAKLEPISSENYELMRGRIVPTFSWQSKEAFIKNGFGYFLIQDGRMAACAFSSGVSCEYVDIGVETAEGYRGKGYGRIVAAAMVKETLRRGKIPVWGCDTKNEASMRLALSLGFETVGTHPWYKYES